MRNAGFGIDGGGVSDPSLSPATGVPAPIPDLDAVRFKGKVDGLLYHCVTVPAGTVVVDDDVDCGFHLFSSSP